MVPLSVPCVCLWNDIRTELSFSRLPLEGNFVEGNKLKL